MNELSEIEILIAEFKVLCKDVEISQLTDFGEKPFECGVWRFWNKSNNDVHIKIEVQKGMPWAIYSNKEFEDKYPIEAKKNLQFSKR